MSRSDKPLDLDSLVPLYVGNDLEEDELEALSAAEAMDPAFATRVGAAREAREAYLEARIESEPPPLWPSIRATLAAEGRLADVEPLEAPKARPAGRLLGRKGGWMAGFGTAAAAALLFVFATGGPDDAPATGSVADGNLGGPNPDGLGPVEASGSPLVVTNSGGAGTSLGGLRPVKEGDVSIAEELYYANQKAAANGELMVPVLLAPYPGAGASPNGDIRAVSGPVFQ